MQSYALEIKAAISCVLGFFTALFGAMGWMVVIWVLCMALDYASGSFAAQKDKSWTSEAARKGLAHKGGMILFVLGAVALDLFVGVGLDVLAIENLPFAYTAPVTALVLSWYILTELGSLFENAQKLGAAFPPGLSAMLNKLKESIFKDDYKP